MGKILRMSPELANKIAAGEVVERPSSVVKELVENSIDANAKSIKIQLKNAGLEFIRITDDGDGMDKDDVEMAFVPHATSKIKTEYDLFRILTLGFRGEAIASIAAVSEMEIISSLDGIEGYRCLYKGGIRKEASITPSNKGTQITVKNLFVNTPARLKYMKSEKSELSSILFFVERIAMAHPDIRFTVYNDDKLQFTTSGSNKIVNLVGEVYGLEAAKGVLETSYVGDGYKAHLVLLKPQFYRSNKLEITLVINGRFVKNYAITNTTVDAYDTFLPIGKNPITILYFDIDPLLVDCNCHPNKLEIKLANETEICALLKKKIIECLKSDILIPTREITPKQTKYEKTSIFDTDILNEEPVYNKPKEETKKVDNSIFNLDIKKDEYIEKEEIKVEEKKIEVKEEPKAIKEEPKKKLPYMEYIGQAFGTYLIFQNDKGLYLMDQHAAAERINYEYYYEILGNNNQPKSDLLIPISLSISKKEALYVEEHIAEFSEIGFDLEQIGDTDFVIRTVPLWAKLDNFEAIAYDVIAKMIENNKVSVAYFRESIAKMVACKASIKANHALSKVEIDTLLERLNKCNNPYTCPHGRPAIINISCEELERMFERIQSK
ncbi:MAG: DNA mismatch repair endonuclease MutL [Acholeplasmatales bacterium]|nr:DNA mismatch repair endonuclease MutL [Acholeplasmatales bacterium]